jgi:hypothetical protein
LATKQAAITVPSSFLDGTLKFVELASFTVKRAKDEVDVHRSNQKRAADLRPSLLAFLMKEGFVAANQKEAADAMLGSHAETMQLLKSAIDKLVEARSTQQKQAGDLGRGEGPKEATDAYNSTTDMYVGRRTSEMKESDKVMMKILDPPTR